MSITEEQVIEALRPVEDPELHRSIVDLGMVKTIGIAGDAVDVQIALTVAGCPLKNEITQRVTGALTGIGVASPSVDFTVMNDEERAAVRQMLHGDPAATAGNNPSHGHAEGRDIPFADPDSRTRVLLIASGKGGVGKSSVTTNLAIALAKRGKSTAIIDADVWGFSIPRMLGIEHAPVVIDDMLIPPETHGVRAISMGFFAATGAEEVITLAIVTGEVAHVLDDAVQLEVHLLAHECGALGHPLRCRLWRRHDVQLRARQELGERKRDIAGAWRKVDQQVLGFVPEHVGEELLERLVQHRPTPDDRLVFLGEEAHRDRTDAVRFWRDQHVVDDDRSVFDTEHARDRESPHVRIDDGRALATLRERDRKVRGDRGFANTTLARRDQQDTCT